MALPFFVGAREQGKRFNAKDAEASAQRAQKKAEAKAPS
jgi:hypothetical protein